MRDIDFTYAGRVFRDGHNDILSVDFCHLRAIEPFWVGVILVNEDVIGYIKYTSNESNATKYTLEP